MEWKLKIHETDDRLTFEMGKGLDMVIHYGNNKQIQFKGKEEHLQRMGFVKIGTVPRLNLIVLVEFLDVPIYKGNIRLPNGEAVELIVCVDENGENAMLSFPYIAFEKILIDVSKQEVILQADMEKLKGVIEESNRLCC